VGEFTGHGNGLRLVLRGTPELRINFHGTESVSYPIAGDQRSRLSGISA
jgi:hypothetical protein